LTEGRFSYEVPAEDIMATGTTSTAPHPPLRLIIGHRPKDDTRHVIVDLKAQAAWKSQEDAHEAWGGDGVETETIVTPELDAKTAETLGLLRLKLRALGDRDDLALAALLAGVAKSCYEAGLRGHESVADRLKRLTDSLPQRP
jgi:hypothetical protein